MFSRLAYTEHLPDEKAATTIAFMARAGARAWFRAHGIKRITRVVTDNGCCYRAGVFLRAMNKLGVSVRERLDDAVAPGPDTPGPTFSAGVTIDHVDA